MRDAWGHQWTFRSQGISRYKVLNREVTAIALDVTRDGKTVGEIAKLLSLSEKTISTYRARLLMKLRMKD